MNTGDHSENTERRSALFAWLIAAGLLAGTRSAFVGLQDGYFQSGFHGLALSSFGRHYSQGFALALAAGLMARMVWVRSGGFVRALTMLTSFALAYAFLSGRVPELPFHKPGFEGGSALAAHGISLLVAAVGVGFLFSCPKANSKPHLGLAWMATVLAIVLGPTLGLLRSKEASWPERPNIILISLDTLRTDHLSCYGYERETSPRIDQFAEQGLRFTEAYAPHPWTLTSHMSMLTGLSPTEHAVEENRRLSHRVPTLAELYEAAGYDTLALVDRVVWLDERYGFERGFASYRRVYGSAAEKINMLDTVFEDLGGGPFFLFLHFFDAHSDVDDFPYESAPEEFRELCGWYEGEFEGCVGEGFCASELLMALNRGQAQVEPEVEQFIVDLYDAGVRTMDRQLGMLFDQLEERGLFENSIVVLTSDHGEELRDHGNYLHGTHYEECVSVPLIVRTPNRTEAQVSPRLVSHVDLAPTLLELSGLDSDLVGGRSYSTLVSRGIETKRRHHILFDAGDGNLGARIDNWKLIQDRGEMKLFDLEADPGEQNNLIASEPPPRQLAELRSILESERVRLLARAEEGDAEARAVDLSEQERRELENVGYAGND